MQNCRFSCTYIDSWYFRTVGKPVIVMSSWMRCFMKTLSIITLKKLCSIYKMFYVFSSTLQCLKWLPNLDTSWKYLIFIKWTWKTVTSVSICRSNNRTFCKTTNFPPKFNSVWAIYNIIQYLFTYMLTIYCLQNLMPNNRI